MVLLYSLAFLGITGGGALGIKRYLNWRAQRDEESALHFRCPRCEKKMRYKQALAGQAIACPGCRRRITLPTQPTPMVRSERRIGQRLTSVR